MFLAYLHEFSTNVESSSLSQLYLIDMDDFLCSFRYKLLFLAVG